MPGPPFGQEQGRMPAGRPAHDLAAAARRRPRRRLLGLGAAGAAVALWASCSTRTAPDPGQGDEAETPGPGRLTARPAPPVEPGPPPGVHPLGLGSGRDGLVYVPAGYRSDHPVPLVVLLHGAGGTAQHGLDLLRPLADQAGVLLLAPESRLSTWDVILGGFGPDVSFIDSALDRTFRRLAVDPERVAVGGFSDGASYALSIGLTNGDLFHQVIAFSPGFASPAERRGSPRLFISHGTGDTVLPIASTSRRIVPRMRRDGYEVTYREFDGPHAVPPEISREGLAWFLGGEA
ncbi:MAG: phospholipase [Actinomycetota bacterium]|nr:phospholipase [Actinomycetota bacterium]